MAFTVVDVAPPQSVGNYKEKLVDVTFDSSYPTNGEAITANELGFSEVLHIGSVNVQGAVVRHVTWDRANAKIVAYAPGGAEVANTTDLAAVTVRLLVRGR